MGGFGCRGGYRKEFKVGRVFFVLTKEPSKYIVQKWKFPTGFLKKDARFSKLKNIPDLLRDEKEGKIMEHLDFSYLSIWASFMGNLVQNSTKKNM